MRITILIATYNVGELLSACLDSVIAQTWRDKEIVVIDGGSTDSTVSIIEKYQEHIAYWCSEPDKGIYDAWNKGLKKLSGEWVLFRGADDVFWDEKALERMINGLSEAGSNERIVYGTTVFVTEDDIVRALIGQPWETSREQFFKEMTIPHSATFHHRSLFAEYGEFDQSFSLAGDYDFIMRVLQNPQEKAKFVPSVIVTRMRDGGASGKQMLKSQRQAMAVQKHNGITGVPWVAYRYLLRNYRSIIVRRAVTIFLGEERTRQLYRWRHSLSADYFAHEIAKRSQ